jgi:hypothetical protein
MGGDSFGLFLEECEVIQELFHLCPAEKAEPKAVSRTLNAD